MRIKLFGIIILLSALQTAYPQNYAHFDLNFSQGTTKGEAILKKYFLMVQKFRERHDGSYPTKDESVIDDILKNPSAYGYSSTKAVWSELINPDNKYAEDEDTKKFADRVVSNTILSTRVDGNKIGSLARKGERDLLSYTNIYFRENKSGKGIDFKTKPSGYYLLLFADGNVEKVPFDEILYSEEKGKGFHKVFRGQSGISYNSVTYEEFQPRNSQGGLAFNKPSIAGNLMVDNGGPESLIQLSRRLGFPNRYGVTREKIWEFFDPTKSEFTLENIQRGATQIGIMTQVQTINLDSLAQKSFFPALLFLKDDGRIVTLTSIDDDRAVVIDRGLTRNIERSVLEKRYSGEALIPAKALNQQTGITADDAVRQVQLQTLEDEVPQRVMLRNTGKTPVTLQLEYPLLGVTESKLSKDTLAAGETATLDLKVKWRSILMAHSQNVLVSLQTSDPIVPRLQLAILLNPPQTPAK